MTASIGLYASSTTPRRATARRSERPTDGHLGAFVAQLHGRPWVPWQRAAADVAGELLPNGRYAYPVVVVLVPRQCGKTTWAFDLAQGRTLGYRDYRAAYCAQTGHVTTERFGERMRDLPPALARTVMTRRSAGTERMTYTKNRSYIKAFPPKDGALRGSALDLVVVDEPQEHDAELGVALDQTILPTFTTRPRRQLILVGTAGTARSSWLRGYMEKAAEGAPGFALIEYGAPAGWDPADTGSYESFHPGLAAGLTDVDALVQARAAMGDASFIREYGNVWTAGADLSPIGAGGWAAARVESASSVFDQRVVGLGYGVARDRAEGATAAAWREQGRVHVRVLEVRPGADWVADRVWALSRELRAPIAWDRLGSAPDVGAEIERREARRTAGRKVPAKVLPLNSPDYAAACVGFAADAVDGELTHADQPPLNVAVAASTRRWIGDRWVWSREGTVSMAALEAATCARAALLQSRPYRGKPRIVGAS